MTEYQAMRIEQGDSSALEYFSTKLLEANNPAIQVVWGQRPAVQVWIGDELKE